MIFEHGLDDRVRPVGGGLPVEYRPHVHDHVVDARPAEVVEQEVAGLERGETDVRGAGVLVGRRVGEGHPGSGPRQHGETRAVDPGGAGAAPEVWHSQVLHGAVHGRQAGRRGVAPALNHRAAARARAGAARPGGLVGRSVGARGRRSLSPLTVLATCAACDAWAAAVCLAAGVVAEAAAWAAAAA